jgi:hypothetical protein
LFSPPTSPQHHQWLCGGGRIFILLKNKLHSLNRTNLDAHDSKHGTHFFCYKRRVCQTGRWICWMIWAR